jgi:FMN-dependent oxidoreductase (nitrilotriacetate monooxygenase family)
MGFHHAAWRLPGAATHGGIDAKFLQRHAQLLEHAKFDYVFIGDFVVCDHAQRYQDLGSVLRAEAITLAGNLAAVTEHIGIAPTVNLTYAHPYTIARSVGTLDHLSGGRALLNVVTGSTPKAAGNYGRDHHWENERRYDWADEFVEALRLLWDSWEDDALIADKDTGEFVDWEKVHKFDYAGKVISVTGPLNVKRPPQGQIPLLNAGTSERSRELGARFSDLRFVSESNLKQAKANYSHLKALLAKHGRDDSSQIISPGLAVFGGETTQDAKRLYNHLQTLVLVPTDLRVLGWKLGVEIDHYADTTRVSDVREFEEKNASARAAIAFAQTNYDDENPTLRQLFVSEIRMGGHGAVVGSVRDVADHIEQWFVEKAADGFNLFPPFHPGCMEFVAEKVVPELQRRGVFQKEYAPGTARERLGLPPAENVFARQRREAKLENA